MELEFDEDVTTTVSAGDVARGNCFKLPTGQTVYMRIHNPHKASYKEDISVVNLATGYSYEFPRSKTVVPLYVIADVRPDS